jgi:methylenetetrahydrofolate dehydrogenase(NAD+) / 5,10-methenyltetrahydrofolate cyclohydrolase
LLSHLHSLNRDPTVDGVLVQLPVPPHIDERRICNAVVPHKDVDGFHIANVGRLCVDQKALVPATPAAVIEIIKRTGDCTLILIGLLQVAFLLGDTCLLLNGGTYCTQV